MGKKPNEIAEITTKTVPLSFFIYLTNAAKT
jgi:hypothetical protein